MRAILVAAIVAGGLAAAGLSSVSAAPVNTTSIAPATELTLESVMKAHWRGPSRPRCHRRWRSWWYWC